VVKEEDDLFTNVLSKDELDAMMKEAVDEDDGLFETVGKAADKIGETKVGKKIGTIITVVLLALLSGGANMSIIHEYFNGEEEGPLGGCLEPNATNYNPQATFDDGSCNFVVIVYGCTDPEAVNYDPQATHDNGRCNILNQSQNNTNNETATNETVYGCMDIDANNFNERATEDDGSCDYERPSNYSLNFYVDLDTNCDDIDEPLPVLVYYDLMHVFVSEDENGNTTMQYDNYIYEEIFYNASGWAADELWFNASLEDNFENIYEGYWFFYISIYADFNGNGDYWDEGEYIGWESNYGDGDPEKGWVLLEEV
jgi:hypothetical protein